MCPSLNEFVTAGVFNYFDQYFAKRLSAVVREESPEILLGAALVSRAVSQGHVCVDLARLQDSFLPDLVHEGVTASLLPDPEKMIAKLRDCPLVSDGSSQTPLVLQGERLYLYRYWRYENMLATHLLRRAELLAEVADQQLLAAGLDRLFPQGESGDFSAQRRAAENAVKRMLAIISGGPGTGKTTTIVKILVLLQEQALARGEKPLDILLLAPTGKAAARLNQSVQDKMTALETGQEVKEAIPLHGSTIHRAMGYLSRHPTRFSHNLENPLKADAVFVDEASMTDIALMAKLFEAVPQTARIVLLGDHHQLASVEAGSILGDICESALQRKTPLSGCVTYLDKSYRFDSVKGIGALLAAINGGDGDTVLSLLDDEGQQGIALKPFEAQTEISSEFQEEILRGFRAYLGAESPAEALRLFERFRILCAHRQGFGGVQHLNGYVEELLKRAGLISGQGGWYRGRPVMVTANNYAMRLYNGDIGIAWPDPAHGENLSVYFAGSSADEVRGFVPWRLPHHETAYAMTIHKSQGSEFDEVLVILPQEISPILTRELIYTAVSRARSKVLIFSSKEVLRQAISRKIERASGLGYRLAPPG